MIDQKLTHYCPDPLVHLPLHTTITSEQDSKNSFSWGSCLIQWGKSTFFHLRTRPLVSDLEKLTLIPASSHSTANHRSLRSGSYLQDTKGTASPARSRDERWAEWQHLLYTHTQSFIAKQCDSDVIHPGPSFPSALVCVDQTSRLMTELLKCYSLAPERDKNSEIRPETQESQMGWIAITF